MLGPPMLRRTTKWAGVTAVIGASLTAAPGCRSVAPATTGRTALLARASAPIAPPVATGDPDQVIDLGAALRLAGVENPTVDLARERVREALAEQLSAKSLLLPSLNVGGNYYAHRGALQTAAGAVTDVNRQSLYLGAGARAVGGGTATVPGVWLFAHLGDAVYEPLAARQRVSATRSDAQAVQNAILRDVAAAYLGLVGAEAQLEILRLGEAEISETVRVTKAYAVAGQGRQGDADRAAANAQLLRRQLREAEEGVGVAAARLSELLNLDPSVRLRTPFREVRRFRLIAESTATETLVTQAVQGRPEVYARSAAIQEALTRRRQEKVRPFVPLVSVGYSGGAFGGGSNLTAPAFGPLNARSNFDVVAAWNMEGFGFGNRARVRQANAGVGQAVATFNRAVNQVRQEVAAAQAEAKAADRQLDTATEALTAAEEGYQLEAARIRQGLGRPIETLDSFRQLLETRQAVVRATVAFDVAQFRLFVAVGSSPLSVSP